MPDMAYNEKLRIKIVVYERKTLVEITPDRTVISKWRIHTGKARKNFDYFA
jgi:hypothetical protein